MCINGRMNFKCEGAVNYARVDGVFHNCWRG
jgi:hypothetical protein